MHHNDDHRATPTQYPILAHACNAQPAAPKRGTLAGPPRCAQFAPRARPTHAPHTHDTPRSTPLRLSA